MAIAAIKVHNLSKCFGEIIAVNSLNFDVTQGEICALLGGNGAGKTTTISMLLGLLIPSSGAINVLGSNMLLNRYRVLPRINFSSPYVDLPKRLTAQENLMVYAKLYGVNDPKKRVASLSSDLVIDQFLDRPFGELSSGQKTRVSLAKSLLNNPDLLFLDEPTASLDPDTADWIRSYLVSYQRNFGATILLASHNMAEVERMCDDVVMMREGSIVDHASPNALITQYGRNNLEEVFLDIARGKTKDEDSNAGDY